jgi:uncharacterized membrane protein YkoI
MLRRHWKLTGMAMVMTVGLTLSLGALASRQMAEQEKAVSIDQVPPAVKATLLAQGGTIEEIEVHMENGRTVYEADVLIGGQQLEVKVAADGSLISQEADDENHEQEEEDGEPLSIDQVPDVVKATILNEAQGGTIKEVERGDEDGQVL